MESATVQQALVELIGKISQLVTDCESIVRGGLPNFAQEIVTRDLYTQYVTVALTEFRKNSLPFRRGMNCGTKILYKDLDN